MHLIKRETEVRPRSNKRSAKEHEKFVLSTGWLCRKLLLAHAAHKGSSIRISRDKNRYTQGRYVPEGISHRVTIEGVLDLMDILGYVKLTDRGNFDRISGEGGQTRYKPTQAFLKHFNGVSSTLPKQLVKDKDHDYSPIQLHRQTLRRIFNSTSFDEGGRFYGAWWQNIPSAYRAFITIDGKFTDEFDYGKLHPTILYADKGITLEDDAYDIGIGDEHRDIVKQTFNAMVQMKQPSNTPPRDIDFKSTGRT